MRARRLRSRMLATAFVALVALPVAVDAGAAGGPGPTLTGVTPASPSSVNTPRVHGTQNGNATITLHTDAACTSAPIGSGTSAQLESGGIGVTVPENATTTIWATADRGSAGG